MELNDDTDTQGAQSPDSGREKPKVVVIMGPTGSGKSRLAIDLASHFPVEVINADSMQVYRGLDVLTNKVPISDQKGVPHHLLGTVDTNVEFTAKEFRDCAIPIIEDILSRNCLPVIVGGTNYYIQALVSPFLLDDSAEDVDGTCSNDLGDGELDKDLDFGRDSFSYSYNDLKEIDPVTANRIHPNDQRKISQHLSLYYRYGVLPSKIFQGKAAENWGRPDCFRYSCCFISVEVSLPVLDQHVNQRVDDMVATGLLNEVFDIYNLNANYTRGLLQAIGVREFEEFLKHYIFEGRCNGETELTDEWMNERHKFLKEKMILLLTSSVDNYSQLLLKDAIAKVKLNTRRLARRQRRRLNRLQTLFGWNIYYIDATESIACKSDHSWTTQVLEPALEIIRSFLGKDTQTVSDLGVPDTPALKTIQRDLWTQYTCKACGNRVLRGRHEWEEHIQGRRHRKRVSRLRKTNELLLSDPQLL